jgi:hypothetical protein
VLKIQNPKSKMHLSADSLTANDIGAIACLFDIPEPITVKDYDQKGNINLHTYHVTDGEGQEYLLQSINERVFTQPCNTMQAMIASLNAQRSYLDQYELPYGTEWLPIHLIPTRTGKDYAQIPDLSYATVWRLMGKIPACLTYKSLSEISDPNQRLRAAEEAGKGMALYLRLTAGMKTEGLESPLPGYRDTRNYYNQLLSVLSGNRTEEDAREYLPQDPTVLHSTRRHFLVHLPESDYRARIQDPILKPFIELAVAQMDYGLKLQRMTESGQISTVAIHGDPKIENFLFDARTGCVKSMIDLDTIMPQTWLVDWGDMARSLVNIAGEKEPDLSRVAVDAPIYDAVTRGFLGASSGLPQNEIELMADATEIMALELGVRFLSDYLRGDSYFRLGPNDPKDLNKIRAMVQLHLFQQLRARRPEVQRQIRDYKP